MPKKKRRATEKKNEEDKSDNRLLNLFLMLVIGPAIIVSSVATKYYVGGLVGSALILWGVWETPEIHPYLKLVINWKTKKQHVEVKRSPDAQVLTAGRDVNVYNPPPKTQTVPDPTQPKIVPGLTVGFEAYGRVPGRHLVFLEASNVGPVPVFIPSISSLKVKMPDGGFWTPTSESWETDKEFPFELKPGRSLTISRDLRGFATQMNTKGYSGKVTITVILRDEANRVFESGPILFDIDDYAKSRA